MEKGHEWQLGPDWLSEIAHGKVEADTVNYNAPIGACLRQQEWQLAKGLLSTMNGAKRAADSISYVATLSACDQMQQWLFAFGLPIMMA